MYGSCVSPSATGLLYPKPEHAPPLASQLRTALCLAFVSSWRCDALLDLVFFLRFHAYLGFCAAFYALAPALSLPFASCHPERRLLEGWLGQARRHGLRPHQFRSWIRRKTGPDLVVWRELTDGSLGCAMPCILCQRELVRFDLRVHCPMPGQIWFSGRMDDAHAPTCKLTHGQTKLMFGQSPYPVRPLPGQPQLSSSPVHSKGGSPVSTPSRCSPVRSRGRGNPNKARNSCSAPPVPKPAPAPPMHGQHQGGAWKTGKRSKGVKS